MRKGIAGLIGLAVLGLGAGLAPSRALAKCSKDCMRLIVTDFKTCKAGCPKGSAGNACQKACLADKKSDTAACKAATNPTPPSCGETTTSTTLR